MDGPGLKAWRTGLGLTLPAGAAKLCISRATLARYEASGEIPAKLAQMVASLDEGVAVQDEDTVQPRREKPGAHVVGSSEEVKAPKPTLAAEGTHANCLRLTVVAVAVLAEEAKPLGLTWRSYALSIIERELRAATERPKPTPGAAVTIPTERTAGMSKLATVRPATKGRRLVGFTSDGKEIWG